MIQINNNNSSSNASNSGSTSSSSRLAAQLSRVANINLVLAKQQQQLQQQQQQQQQDGAAATSGGNLSPHIMLNVGSSGPLLTTTTSINNATAIRRPSTTKSPPPPVEVVAASVVDDAGVKVAARFGDYVFYELANATETFGTAVNEKTKALFNWKKFERRDYMKKLEPYMVMDGACEQIYRFSEIIFSSNYVAQGSSSGSENSNSTNDDVYVLFEQHYGDLHSFMKEKKRLEENEARLIFRQCVEAVQSCHDNGIIIRDIKLKKFVFLDEQRTKIGLANLEDCLLLEEDAENDLIKSQQGCPAYVSPEVLNPIQTSYSGKLSDAWSLGIILYTLLVGRYPFHHPTIANMFARIARGKFQVPLSVSLSLDARILLRSLIRVKPDERLLPHEILAHNWFRHHNETSLSAATSTPIHLNHCQQAKNSTATNIHLNLAANNHRSATVPALIDQSGDDACVPSFPITN